MALNSCSAYVTPASDDPETLKELKRKSVPTSQLAPAEYEVELRNSSRG
jgi:hypothetical protein